mgnify:CR=1 FL=1
MQQLSTLLYFLNLTVLFSTAQTVNAQAVLSSFYRQDLNNLYRGERVTSKPGLSTRWGEYAQTG